MEGTNGQRATDADNYHYFAWDNKGGISGIAGLGTVCLTSRNSRTAITEWIGGADSHYAENQCVLVRSIYHISLEKAFYQYVYPLYKQENLYTN